MIQDLERCFSRAFYFSFNKKKLLFSYPFVFLAGLVFIFFKSMISSANNWIFISKIFLPLFISFAIFFVLGTLLIKIHYHEVKKLGFSYRDILKKSSEILNTFYFSVPIIFVFLVLWIIFGIFVGIKNIPHIGSFIGVFLSIIPFLIILMAILLVIFSVGTLFFITPELSLGQKKKKELIKNVFVNFRKNLFINLMLFFIASIVVFIVLFILFLSVSFTKTYFVLPLNNIYSAFTSFFLMIPFTLFLTPFIVFFFNFALESYNLLKSKEES